MSEPLAVLHVASELFPLVKTGGLGDVVGALPAALEAHGVDARVLVPGYPAILDAMADVEPIDDVPDFFGGGAATLWSGVLLGVRGRVYVLESPGLFDRSGGPYHDASGREHPDNHVRFAALGHIASRIAAGVDPSFRPEILHAHDWQASIAVAALSQAPAAERPATIQTIHNLAYPGRFAPEAFEDLGLPASLFGIDGLEFYGDVSFLKGGVALADRVTTVSPTYAEEIQQHGHGLEGLLRSRARDLVGILNGIDTQVWDPRRDPHLPVRYGRRDVERRAACKDALRQRLGLVARAEAPLFGLVSRLSPEKGIDLLLDALPVFVAQGAQLAVLGTGEPALEAALEAAAAAHPDNVAVVRAFDEGLAHLFQAGADVTLVPSRIEPCGLTQMYAQRYGALPLVRRTGGLADTVVNATDEAVSAGDATGFVFDDPTADALAGTVRWACEQYQDPGRWRRIQRTGMKRDFGWGRAAGAYATLYRDLRTERV